MFFYLSKILWFVFTRSGLGAVAEMIGATLLSAILRFIPADAKENIQRWIRWRIMRFVARRRNMVLRHVDNKTLRARKMARAKVRVILKHRAFNRWR